MTQWYTPDSLEGLCEFIRGYRATAGLSMEEMANVSGVGLGTISRIEALAQGGGSTQSPNAVTIDKILVAVGFQLLYLADRDNRVVSGGCGILDIGSYIVRLRKALGLTQSEFSALTGVEAIGKLEVGGRPRMSLVYKMALSLDLVPVAIRETDRLMG